MSRLGTFLTPQQILSVLGAEGYLDELSSADVEKVFAAFSLSYNKQYLVLLGFAALGLVGSLCLGLMSLRKL